MDWWIVKQLRAMILTDLRDFVPPGYFESKVETLKFHDSIRNSGHLSRELRWGYLAGSLGKSLFYEATTLSARQVSACEVLMNLGMLASAEATQAASEQMLSKVAEVMGFDGTVGAVAGPLGDNGMEILTNNVSGALTRYLRYLTPLEAAPFKPLLGQEETSQVQGTHPVVNNFNFQGTVGSVQTGANAVANVVQNLGADERTALVSALQQVKEAIGIAPSLPEPQRRELLEIAHECSSQLESESPNDTQFLNMFNVLGTTIQSIAGVQPAYQVLKTALLAVGITLP
ncbi:MAG: hypothetical protein WCV99_10550 [Sterolibacterium sp.]